MQTRQERENGGERVIYIQAQGSMNKYATRKVSREGNKRKGKMFRCPVGDRPSWQRW